MRQQGSGSYSSPTDELTVENLVPRQHIAEQAIMMLLLSGEHQGLWTRSEIELELSSSPLDIQDALVALQASGLIHLRGEFVSHTRAAQRMDELDI